MVKVTKQNFYMNETLKDNLDIYKKSVRKDMDCVLFVDGAEGSGKSVLAQQVGFYFDQTLTVEKIVFKPTSFKKAIVNAKKYECIVWDESRSGINARRSMSMTNNMIVDMLAEIRQKNLFIIIVMPTFFDADRNIALWRTKALIHVYFGAGYKRGKFRFYNTPKKKELYMLGKKMYDYKKPHANFIGDFMNHYTVDEQEYRKKKYEELRAFDKEKEVSTAYRLLSDRVSKALYQLRNAYTHQQLGEFFGMDRSAIGKRIRGVERSIGEAGEVLQLSNTMEKDVEKFQLPE